MQGILALLLSLKKKPVIRWEKMSGVAKKLAEDVSFAMHSSGGVYGDLFGFRGTSGPSPQLIILGMSLLLECTSSSSCTDQMVSPQIAATTL